MSGEPLMPERTPPGEPTSSSRYGISAPLRAGVRRTLSGIRNAAVFTALRDADTKPPSKVTDKSTPLAAALGVVAPPLDLRILGRTLLHAALVGLAAGLVGAAFFAGLEYTQALLLERWAGYVPLRAHGEKLTVSEHGAILRPILMVLLPAVGGLLSGLLCRLAPEARGGGGDAMIHAFHHQGGVIRRRVIWVKALASIFTLGSGGSGGREGPTMHIGGALGSTVAGLLRVSPRERRTLMVAGVSAGMAAVFRTPLGAALLAVEVLYRDDFEAEALVPAILASVVAYSVVIATFGESRLFDRASHYVFTLAQLPLYALMAVLIAAAASTFLASLRGAQRLSSRLPVPVWARPAIGGLALSVLALPLLLFVGSRVGTPGRALGIFGGGYGVVQVAITGAAWLPGGWHGVELLLFLALAKLVATSCTIGTGGSAGDFGPSLVLGGLVGGAFGRAAAVLLHDPSIDPGAFALVGMGTFYGGIAHVPISSLIMVCELAGSYDLLVPLMLAEGIAFVALRKRYLYHAQLPGHDDSPAHHRPGGLDFLTAARVEDLMIRPAPYTTFEPRTPLSQMAGALAQSSWQAAFPVVDAAGLVLGVVGAELLGALSSEVAAQELAVASDFMQPGATVEPTEPVRRAAELLLETELRQLVVIGPDSRVIGFIGESDVMRAHLESLVLALERKTTGTHPALAARPASPISE
jgi:CIC family chloride channel protein